MYLILIKGAKRRMPAIPAGIRFLLNAKNLGEIGSYCPFRDGDFSQISRAVLIIIAEVWGHPKMAKQAETIRHV
jgi:hypothetical protein